MLIGTEAVFVENFVNFIFSWHNYYLILLKEHYILILKLVGKKKSKNVRMIWEIIFYDELNPNYGLISTVICHVQKFWSSCPCKPSKNNHNLNMAMVTGKLYINVSRSDRLFKSLPQQWQTLQKKRKKNQL